VGLLDSLLGSMRMDDPVRGTAQVVSTSGNDGEAVWQNTRMHLVVQADGLPPTAVEHYAIAPTAKWPMPGQVLPVTVDRANPQRLKIIWEGVEHSGERAARSAEALAAQMRGLRQQPPVFPTAPAPAPTPQVDVVEELSRLAALHSSGALTDEEFAAAKKKILE
jgi:hypothetical protein